MNTTNRQSFFKLPFIFISVFFIIFFGLMYVFLLKKYYAYSDLPNDYLFKQLFMFFVFNLSILLLFFITSIFFCHKFRLYSIADFGIKVALIGLIFALCYFGIKILYIIIFDGIVDLFKSSTESFMSLSQIELWLTLINKLASLIIFIISIFLLYLLFLLFAKTNVTKRQVYILEGLTGSQIYAHVFSSLMLLFIALFGTNVVYQLIYRILFELYDGRSNLIVLFAFLLLMVLYYAIFYFAVRNRFTKIDSSIKFGKLLITVIITIIFTLIVPIFYQIMIFVKLFSDNLIGGYISFILIHFIFCFCSSRLSVKIMYH